MKRKWSPRLNIEITEEQYFTLQKLPHGCKKALFCFLAEQITTIIGRGETDLLVKLAAGECEIKIVPTREK